MGKLATLEPKKEIRKKITVPTHIAIIMDGNRRWAKKKVFKTIMGHRKGVESFEKILKFLREKEVKILTVYAFSTENWKRSKEQINDLLTVMSGAISEKADDFIKENVVLRIIGGLDRFPKEIRVKLENIVEKTRNNTGQILNVALNYGGRDELVRAVRRLASSGKEITDDSISSSLDTAGQPDPDIIIRTGGAKRLSNFLLWQGSYSELFFTDTLWPDFNEKEMGKILEEYKERKRNFGA